MIAGKGGALKPRPQLALSNSSRVALNFSPSFGVTEYMKRQGYEIIPVNPNIEETLGQEAWERLVDVPGKIDIVNIFRRSEFAGRIVDDAIRVGAGCVWLQEGVVDYSAAQRAEAAGVGVVMDRCILKEHARLLR